MTLCGTHKGWRAHRRKKEYPCNRCTTFKTQYDTSRRIINGQRKGVNVNLEHIAEMYNMADVYVRSYLECILGMQVIDAINKRWLDKQGVTDEII